MTDDYRASLEFLYGRLNYERVGMPPIPSELRLGRMRRLLRALGDPQNAYGIVHVAGTKGKGSTSAMLAAAISAAGVPTGLYCSPHLHRLEERFRFNGVEASPDELVELTNAIRPAVAKLDADGLHRHHRGPTFFEITTAMGLLHFARRGAQVVVLEVGMGGRLDSTNVVRPWVSIVTSISFDHTRQLGTTLAAIAQEKAGIFKRECPAISGVRGTEAILRIREIARQRRSPLRELDVHFSYTYEPPPQRITRPTPGTVSVRTWEREWPSIRLPLLGAHQAQNAACALCAIDVLTARGLVIDADAVQGGFDRMTFPARVEVVGEAPWIVIDGAHNVASAEALAETLHTCVPEGPRTLVFGTTREKDLRGQLRVLLPLFDRFVATRYVENPRSVPPHEIAEAIFELSGRLAAIEPSPAAALRRAHRVAPNEGVICVTGSLFLAAEARAVLLGIKPTITIPRKTP
jgi:dihydrofolate synthase/folylpolyglutamate synthase